MTTTPPSLPTRFPCWCRAIYSWGGETKRDLGFVEGDLIECLNAGDGSWWMGRLRRDKRMMGLFPSNFVQVLDDSFQPASRASSPMPDRSPSPNPFNPQPPKETKSKPFRKPFQAYAAPDPAAERRLQLQRQEGLMRSGGSPSNPGSLQSRPDSMHSRPGSLQSRPDAMHSRPGSLQMRPSPSRSPMPRTIHDNIPRVPSPEAVNGYGSRAVSPVPSFGHRLSSRAPSRNPSRAPSPGPGFHEADSPPPPAPPPHRHLYAAQRIMTSSPAHSTGHHTPRASSPSPPSPGATGLTPSPLRSAMEDVMSSLQDMELSRTTHSPEPHVDPWSPEAFDQTFIKAARRNGPPRPNTSLGFLDHDQDSMGHQPPLSRVTNTDLNGYEKRLDHDLSRQGSSRSNHVMHSPMGPPPTVPPKAQGYKSRPHSPINGIVAPEPKLRHRKSAFEVGKQMLVRTLTTKSSATNSSSGAQSTSTHTSASTQLTERSIMSGHSAGAFSATSAGSLARKKEALYGRAQSAMGHRTDDFLGPSGPFASNSRPTTPLTGAISFHSSHASQPPLRPQSHAGWHEAASDSRSVLGGFAAPRPKKSGFFKKIIESARTGAASARSITAAGEAVKGPSSVKSGIPDGVTAIAGGSATRHSAQSSSDNDWLQVRRDVNRSNSLSRIERIERKERCQMMDYPAISPVEELYHLTDGDEGVDGRPVVEPINFQAVNLSLVDKNTRFINSVPPLSNPMSLATSYVCRPYKSDVQRLRAIFTWVSERIAWEEAFEGEVDTKRVIQTRRGSPEEVAVLVMEMCAAVGIRCEAVPGFLKTPGEVLELGVVPHTNHWWNAVAVDGEWRIMDCSLASSTHPRRSMYSSCSNQTAEGWWFLTRTSEICWTHIPEYPEQQHMCPPVAHDILLALPCVCPPFFKQGLEFTDFNTSMLRIEDLEVVQISLIVPPDIECVAEVEARAFARDNDGDFFESGDLVKKRALSQAEWTGGQKRYTIKALLPGQEGHGVLKIYAGKRGLMHSIKDIPHPLAIALPMTHTGENPPYEFVIRHPTPHAQRHDLYVAQPQCHRLAINNTFVFAIRQHPSSFSITSPNPGGTSPIPFVRPSSAMSFTNSSASGSNPSTTNGAYSSKKPAKLAIQAPGGKILRLMRKDERTATTSSAQEAGDGGTWETIIKCGERGVWRGLVLADRSARWCVFAEWVV